MNHKNVNEREPFGFVSRMFGFTQPGCYASIVNITNFKNKSEQNIHRFIFDLPEYYSYLDSIKIYVKVVIDTIIPALRTGATF